MLLDNVARHKRFTYLVNLCELCELCFSLPMSGRLCNNGGKNMPDIFHCQIAYNLIGLYFIVRFCIMSIYLICVVL